MMTKKEAAEAANKTMGWRNISLSWETQKQLKDALEPIVAKLMNKARTQEERALYLHSMSESCWLEIWLLACKLKRDTEQALLDPLDEESSSQKRLIT